MTPDLRKRLFAVQQRLAITGGEALAIFGFVVLMAVGSVLAHVDRGRTRADTATYAALDAAIAAGARMTVEEATASPPGDSVAAEPASQAQVTPRRPLAPVRLDPNTASSQALQRLPGIGPALAGRIIEYRELHGPFRTPRDLLAVKGIGAKTFERLEPYLRIAAPEEAAAGQSATEPGAVSSGSSAAPSPP